MQKIFRTLFLLMVSATLLAGIALADPIGSGTGLG
jgi:hypothetical protein